MTTTLKASKAKTNCNTFRIPANKLDLLHLESATKQVSLNTLVNRILNEYLQWHSLASSAKLYYLPKSFLIAKNDLVDISLFLKGKFNLTSISEITETWLRIAQMSYRSEISGDSCRIVIQHDMGLKYSYLIKEISRYLLGSSL